MKRPPNKAVFSPQAPLIPTSQGGGHALRIMMHNPLSQSYIPKKNIKFFLIPKSNLKLGLLANSGTMVPYFG